MEAVSQTTKPFTVGAFAKGDWHRVQTVAGYRVSNLEVFRGHLVATVHFHRVSTTVEYSLQGNPLTPAPDLVLELCYKSYETDTPEGWNPEEGRLDSTKPKVRLSFMLSEWQANPKDFVVETRDGRPVKCLEVQNGRLLGSIVDDAGAYPFCWPLSGGNSGNEELAEDLVLVSVKGCDAPNPIPATLFGRIIDNFKVGGSPDFLYSGFARLSDKEQKEYASSHIFCGWDSAGDVTHYCFQAPDEDKITRGSASRLNRSLSGTLVLNLDSIPADKFNCALGDLYPGIVFYLPDNPSEFVTVVQRLTDLPDGISRFIVKFDSQQSMDAPEVYQIISDQRVVVVDVQQP